MEFAPAQKARRLVIFAALALIIAAIRIPFLANTLLAEEGYFAFLVAGPERSADFTASRTPSIMVGKIDGKYVFTSFQHAIIPYHIMESGLGSILRPLDVLSMSFDNRNRIVRSGFLLMFMIGAMGLLYLSAASIMGPGPWIWKAAIAALPIYVLTTPLAFGASTQTQVDGGVGVLLTGLAGWLLVSGRERPSLGYFVAGLLIGMGRTEWVVGMIGVLTALAIIGWMLRTPSHRVLATVALGLVCGLCASVLASFQEFIASFHIIGRLIGYGEILATVKIFLRFTWPLIILLCVTSILSLIYLRQLLKERPAILIALGLGAALFVGFTMSGWAADRFPRYFAPALILTTYALTVLLMTLQIPYKTVIASAGVLLLAFGFVQNYTYLSFHYVHQLSITSLPDWPYKSEMEEYRKTAELAEQNGTILIDNTSIWLYYPNVSFISEGVPLIIEILKKDPHLSDRIPERKIR